MLGERNKTSVSLLSAITRETSFLTRQSSFNEAPSAGQNRPSAKSSEFSIDLINENKESIFELQLINTITKQFRTFSSVQKKQFLNKFINSCKSETINEIILYIEPLNHRDFCINAQKEYPEWVEIDAKHRIIFSSNDRKQNESKVSKKSGMKSKRNSALGSAMRSSGLGLRHSALKTSFRTPTFSLTLRHRQSFSNAPLQSSAKSQATVTSKLKSARKSALSSRRAPKEVFKVEIPPDPPAKYSIENFLSEKSSTLLRTKWSLDAEILKPKGKQQQLVPTSTDNMIEKLKNVFREQFESRLDEHDRIMLQRARQRNSMASIKENKVVKKFTSLIPMQESIKKEGSGKKKGGSESMRKNSLISKTPISSSTTKLIETAIDELDADDQQPLYLKKIKNNFYERKLWNSLELENKGNQLNFHPEIERQYTTEFSITQRYDWTQSKFGKTLSKYKIIPAIKSSDADKDDVQSEHSTIDYPWPALSREATKSREQRRQDFIIICDKFFMEIKNWSNSRKVTLLSSLLKYCPNFILLFIRDLISERIESKEKNINCLPDYILLQIFKNLEIESLDEAAKVCQRWDYLVNMDELWIYKCQSLGKFEKLLEVERVIYSDLEEDEEIDWRQAYSELVEFVNNLKTDKFKTMIDNFGSQNFNEESSSVFENDRRKSVIGKEYDLSRRGSLASLTDGTRRKTPNYVNFYVLELEKLKLKNKKKKGGKDTGKEGSKASSRKTSRSNSASSNNTSRKMSTDSTEIRSSVKFDPVLVTKLMKELSDLSIEEEDKMREKFPSRISERRLAVVRLDGSIPYEITEKVEETKLELKQSRDLLGKIMPNYRLRWKAKSEDEEDLKASEKILYNIKPIVQVRILKNNFGNITCMDYDKRRLITGSMDRSVVVYDVRNGEFIKKLNGHKGGIRCLQLLHNRLCSGSWDCTIKIWNLITFKLEHTIFDSKGAFSCLDMTSTYLIAGSHDKSIRIWTFDSDYVEDNYPPKESHPEEDAPVIKFMRKIDCNNSDITALKYDGLKTIIAATVTGSIFLIDLNGIILHQLQVSNFIEPILCLKLVGALIICSSQSGKLMFWNRFTNDCEAIIQCHSCPVRALAFFDGRFFTGGDDGLIKEWDLRTLTSLREIKAHQGAVNSIIVTDVKIITCGADKLARLWEMTTPINKIPQEALF